MKYLEIGKHNIETILELFNMSKDSEGFITKRRTGERIKCPYTKEFINITNFSILPGSATFVNNKSFAFSEHMASHQ